MQTHQWAYFHCGKAEEEEVIAHKKELLQNCIKCGRWTPTMHSFKPPHSYCEHCVYKLMEKECPCGECYAERMDEKNQEEIRKYNEGFGNFVPAPAPVRSEGIKKKEETDEERYDRFTEETEEEGLEFAQCLFNQLSSQRAE